MTQSSLSARLAGAAVSPGAGGGTDSLLKKPENVKRKKLRREICMCLKSGQDPGDKQFQVCRTPTASGVASRKDLKTKQELMKRTRMEESIYNPGGNRRSGETEEQQKQADGGGR